MTPVTPRNRFVTAGSRMALSALGPVTKLRDFIQAINYENPPRAHSTLEKPVEEKDKGSVRGGFSLSRGVSDRVTL